MENDPHSANKQSTATESKLANHIKALNATLASIPGQRLSEIFNAATELADMDLINECIEALFLRAKMGSPEAIEYMHRLGIAISEQLHSLATTHPKQSSQHAKSNEQGEPDSNNDQRAILDRLHSIASLGGVVPHIARILGRVTDTSCCYREIKQVILTWTGNGTLSRKDESDLLNEDVAKEPISYAIQLCSLIIDEHLRREVYRVTRNVASNSHQWPIDVFPLINKGSDHVLDDVNKIGLGDNLVFRLMPKSGKGGRNRFKSGSPTAFALNPVIALDAERQIASTFPERAFDKLKVLASCNPKVQHDLERKWRPVGPIHITGLPAPYDLLMFELESTAQITPWMLYAYLLPPLATDKSTIDKWVHAAMEWAEWQCRGEWDDYNWPDCVLKKAAHPDKNGNKHSKKTSVQEMLRKGIRGLCRLPSSEEQQESI